MASISSQFSIKSLIKSLEKCVKESCEVDFEISFGVDAKRKYRGNEIVVDLGVLFFTEKYENGEETSYQFWHCPHYIIEVPSLKLRCEEEPGFCDFEVSWIKNIAYEIRRQVAILLLEVRDYYRTSSEGLAATEAYLLRSSIASAPPAKSNPGRL